MSYRIKLPSLTVIEVDTLEELKSLINILDGVPEKTYTEEQNNFASLPVPQQQPVRNIQSAQQMKAALFANQQRPDLKILQ